MLEIRTQLKVGGEPEFDHACVTFLGLDSHLVRDVFTCVGVAEW